jgi:cellulose synthase/poly-beta-1,6-N-acetylglucosamine synthase-like glycosyltransferase
MIAARTEKYVIGNLLDSINKQDYPKDLVTIFVVADNCTDNTAEIARSKGAICYERFDNEHKTKGFALQYLCEKIEENYGRMNYEGYFIFDADNLLNLDYIKRMNEAFDAGEKIITSYRNTKNFDENWIASTYGLHWIRSIRMNHRARSV